MESLPSDKKQEEEEQVNTEQKKSENEGEDIINLPKLKDNVICLDRTFVLVSSEGSKEEIDEKSAIRSGLIRDLIADYSNEEISLPEINGEVLKMIVKYLKHYRDHEPQVIPKPHPLHDLKEVTDEWDVDYINSVGWDVVEDIIIGANYMNIKPLMDLACAKIASLMKRKTAEEIRIMFNMGECDIPPEELNELDQYYFKQDV